MTTKAAANEPTQRVRTKIPRSLDRDLARPVLLVTGCSPRLPDGGTRRAHGQPIQRETRVSRKTETKSSSSSGLQGVRRTRSVRRAGVMNGGATQVKISATNWFRNRFIRDLGCPERVRLDSAAPRSSCCPGAGVNLPVFPYQAATHALVFTPVYCFLRGAVGRRTPAASPSGYRIVLAMNGYGRVAIVHPNRSLAVALVLRIVHSRAPATVDRGHFGRFEPWAHRRRYRVHRHGVGHGSICPGRWRNGISGHRCCRYQTQGSDRERHQH